MTLPEDRKTDVAHNGETCLEEGAIPTGELAEQLAQVLQAKCDAVRAMIEGARAPFQAECDKFMSVLEAQRQRLDQETEQARAELRRQHDERRAELAAELATINQRGEDLKALDRLIGKWQNANRWHAKCTQGPTLFHWLLARFFDERRQTWEGFYRARKAEYDAKWEGK